MPQILPRNFKDRAQKRPNHIPIHFLAKKHQGFIWIVKKHLDHGPLPPLITDDTEQKRHQNASKVASEGLLRVETCNFLLNLKCLCCYMVKFRHELV